MPPRDLAYYNSFPQPRRTSLLSGPRKSVSPSALLTRGVLRLGCEVIFFTLVLLLVPPTGPTYNLMQDRADYHSLVELFSSDKSILLLTLRRSFFVSFHQKFHFFVLNKHVTDSYGLKLLD